jgi:hypothetical protein
LNTGWRCAQRRTGPVFVPQLRTRRLQRVLFFDNREEKVAGGAAAGMRAIKFMGLCALQTVGAARSSIGVFWTHLRPWYSILAFDTKASIDTFVQ